MVSFDLSVSNARTHAGSKHPSLMYVGGMDCFTTVSEEPIRVLLRFFHFTAFRTR